MVCPNFSFSTPFIYGKSYPFGGVKFKTFSGFQPQSNFNTFKHNQEGNSSHFYEVTHFQVPRIPQFFCEETQQKGDVTYREWRF